ncbi:type IX secretion/gliding motility protein PorT/SprT [Ochrovirga pacifica]|uniref:type IX secretion/gliding motility protein PorT/SprT n=1 Tax=Ochrovirga pacifica TaxID=1042376 RepID=UPI00135F12D5|nr:porin family protein [Ochrovirga pacifica]
MVNKIVLLLLLTTSLTFAQEEKIQRLQHFDKSKLRFGFYLGLNNKGYRIARTESATSTSGTGFQLGVLADYKLDNYFSVILEPGVLSTRNQLTFGETSKRTFDINNTYFHFPVSLKLNTERINNIRAFATAGLAANYNFNADDNNTKGGADPYDFSLAKTTVSAEISLGLNFYLPYFKFSPSIRGIYGINNEFNALGAEARNYGPDGFYQRAILLNLTFQ